MKKWASAVVMMMEMYMWTCCMCVTFRMPVSDRFSTLKAKCFAA